MIDRVFIKGIATDYLNSTLGKKYPGTAKGIINSKAFDEWARLCAGRCMEMESAGFIKSRYALNQFVKQAAKYYALRRMEILDKKEADKTTQLREAVMEHGLHSK